MAGFIRLDDDTIVNLIGRIIGEEGGYGFGKCIDEESCNRGLEIQGGFEKNQNPCWYGSLDVCGQWECVIITNSSGGGEEFGVEEKRKREISNCVEYRMTELTAMKRYDIEQSEDKTIIHTKVRKGKRIKEFNIKMLKRNHVCCVNGALRLWLMDSHCGKGQEGSIWWNFSHNRALGSLGCSSELKELILQADIDDEFGGNTIRHPMMTKLRQEGASLEYVNEFTRHASGSSVADRFYNMLEKADDLDGLYVQHMEMEGIVMMGGWEWDGWQVG
ncbi:MAG: hypothetical protein EZS28_038399 [Streblomastix strix]|uniref:Tyr recombinase domain-containing protein n=1 Tax=Streblomastix strix TaxID=222440 RepID=A0A5J4U8Q1_9EUKA|nr:MAG: hypothetical protein EZS28_038399 [Streblomastix strix]